MGFIGSSFPKLESWLRSFSIEVFSEILKPAWIREALATHGRQTKRIRKLPAELIVWLSIGLGVFRTLSIRNVLARLGTILGVGSLWGSASAPAGSAIAEARDRVGFGPLRSLFRRLSEHLLGRHRSQMLWKGLTLLALDGTTFKVPDSPENRRRFGLPGINRGGRAAFPQMRSVFLVSPLTRFVLAARFGSFRRSELDLAHHLSSEIPADSLVILDRGFAAWRFLFPLRAQGAHYLVRVPLRFKARRRWALGPGDALIEIRTRSEVRQRFPEAPRRILLRQIHVRIRGVEMRYWTSLLDAKVYPAVDLVRLYAQRWEEEIGFDELKTHQAGLTTVNRPVLFRSQTSRRVLQEAWSFLIAYNLIRAVMSEAAVRASVVATRLSFVDALERIRQGALLMAAARTDRLPRIYDELLESLATCRLPVRRRRDVPRAVAIKMSAYAKKWKSA